MTCPKCGLNLTLALAMLEELVDSDNHQQARHVISWHQNVCNKEAT